MTSMPSSVVIECLGCRDGADPKKRSRPCPECGGSRTVSPRWQHDCERCVFLGHVVHHGLLTDGRREPFAVDLYACKNRLDTTLVGRWSSDGCNYTSSPHTTARRLRDARASGELGESTVGPVLGIALDRAERRGLL